MSSWIQRIHIHECVKCQTGAVHPSALAALGEPNRLRIVLLLGEGPRTVGEIATLLGLRQPQVTKHLQTLEHAGVVRTHVLGRRRLCALERDLFHTLSAWAAALAAPGEDDDALERYGAAVAAARADPVQVHRVVPASIGTTWRAFTDPEIARRWWHPRSFTVTAQRLVPAVGTDTELVLAEGDGATYRSTGHVIAAEVPFRLEFTLDPLGADGLPLFVARHRLRLTAAAEGTLVDLTVTPSAVQPGAEGALGGLAIGWEQLLDALAAEVGAPPGPGTDRREARRPGTAPPNDALAHG
jgi:uncharacterized protein YndB with AHSA1/START domain/DNA-binding HxlR family transcriptional regulator